MLNDDSWRSGYDAWKLASPYDDEPWRSCCWPLPCGCDDCLDREAEDNAAPCPLMLDIDDRCGDQP